MLASGIHVLPFVLNPIKIRLVSTHGAGGASAILSDSDTTILDALCALTVLSWTSRPPPGPSDSHRTPSGNVLPVAPSRDSRMHVGSGKLRSMASRTCPVGILANNRTATGTAPIRLSRSWKRRSPCSGRNWTTRTSRLASSTSCSSNRPKPPCRRPGITGGGGSGGWGWGKRLSSAANHVLYGS